MAVIGKILEEFDGSNDLAQAQREALEALASLAEAKREIFVKQINLLILDAGVGSNKTVPISSVVRSDGMSRAYSSSSAKDIADTLKEAIGGFVEGGTANILDGIFAILTRTLELFLGSTGGQELTKEEYFVYSTDFAIYRVDLMAWSRSVTATSLKQKMEQTTAYSYVLSTVDVDAISWSDFVAIFALQLDKDANLTKAERDDARARMLETWNFLKGPSSNDVADLKVASTVASIEAKYKVPLLAYN